MRGFTISNYNYVSFFLAFILFYFIMINNNNNPMAMHSGEYCKSLPNACTCTGCKNNALVLFVVFLQKIKLHITFIMD